MRDMENYFVTFYGNDGHLGPAYLVHTIEDGLKALRCFADDETLPDDDHWNHESVWDTPHGVYFFGGFEYFKG
jgi:hypothetical protein